MAENELSLIDVSWPGRATVTTEPTADFVFVHGLNPRNTPDFARATWTHSNHNFWPTEQLQQVAPASRVFLYSYNSHVARDVSQMGIDGHATNLLDRLLEKREPDKDAAIHRPIVFVAHSMGGLVVKQALVNAKYMDRYKDILDATTALVFFAVPHQGGNGVKLGTIARNIITAVSGEEKNDLLESLAKNSLFQEAQARSFREQLENYQILSVFEDLETVLLERFRRKKRMIIVNKASATLGLPSTRETIISLNANHSNVCRFTGDDDLKFEPLKNKLGRFARLLPKQTQQQASRPVRLLRASSPTFVGREQELEILRQKLFGHESCSELALVGLGGVGKTQIAAQFANEIAKEYPDCSIFWVSAVSFESFEGSYKRIAQHLKLTLPAGEEFQTVRYVNQYLSCNLCGRWLLILDNLDSLDIFSDLSAANGNNLRSMFPHNQNGAILFTCRDRDTASTLATANVLEIKNMPAELAKQMLSSILIDKERMVKEADVASELLANLEYLPLAITQAAAYINRSKETLSTYLDLLRDTEDTLACTLSREFQDRDRDFGSINAVAVTLAKSFQRMEAECPHAAYILSFLSCIEFSNIPELIIRDDQFKEPSMNAIGTLSAYSFIVRRENERIYDMHRLVHVAARIWVRSKETSQDLVQLNAIEHLDSVYPYPTFENKNFCGSLFPHVYKAINDSKEKNNSVWGRLCIKIGTALRLDGRVKESLPYFQMAEEWASTSRPEDESSILWSQRELAIAYQTNGQMENAVDLLERVVQRQQDVLEYDSFRQASKLALATAYHASGQTEKAQHLLESLLKTQESLPRGNSARLASQHTLAMIYQSNDQSGAAIKLLEEVVEFRKGLVDNHPDRLASQQALAMAYRTNGQVTEAIGLLQQVAKVREALAESHPDRLMAQSELASAYQVNGQVEEAIALLVSVVQIQEATLEKQHIDLLASQHSLAIAYHTDNQTEKALKLLELVTQNQNGMAEDHPHRLRSLHWLAKMYQDHGQLTKAIELQEGVVRVKGASLPKGHPSRLTSQQQLALMYIDNGQLEEGHELHAQVAEYIPLAQQWSKAGM